MNANNQDDSILEKSLYEKNKFQYFTTMFYEKVGIESDQDIKFGATETTIE